MSKKVAVIGAGLGGLAVSLLLNKQGYDVTIFEKNEEVGGKINNLMGKGFRFDMGASLVTMPFVLKELFELLDLNIKDYIQIDKLEIITKYFYPDGISINAYSNIDNFVDEIERKTTENEKSIRNYFEYSKRIYDLTSDLFIFNDFTSISKLFNKKGLNTLFNIRGIDPFRTIHQANSSFFSDKKILQIFDRYATYNGSNPYKAPATLNIIPYVEYYLGGYYFSEGMYSLINVLENLCNHNKIQILKNSEVTRIGISPNGPSFLFANEQKYEFDYIISNSDVNHTFTNLLQDSSSSESKRNSKNQASSSALVFYWGVNGNYPQLETHNILFSENYFEEFAQIFDKKQLPDDPTIYIYISSKFNPTDAPNGYENWFVMINTPENLGQDWDKIIEKYRPIIINKIKDLTGINIKDNIIFESTLTPEAIEKNTLSSYGSIYGISSNTKSAAFLRQKNRSKTHPNLFFVGGSVHPGGGIPLVLSSAMIVSKMFEEMND